MERYYKLWFRLFSCFILLASCFLPLASCFLVSCQEGGDAGDLFGQWRLTESKYISFSGSVVSFLSVNVNNSRPKEVFGKFQHQGDSVFIQCSSVKKEKSDTLMVEDEFGMKPFNNIRVKIDAIDSDRLILSKDGKIWSLKKW